MNISNEPQDSPLSYKQTYNAFCGRFSLILSGCHLKVRTIFSHTSLYHIFTISVCSICSFIGYSITYLIIFLATYDQLTITSGSLSSHIEGDVKSRKIIKGTVRLQNQWNGKVAFIFLVCRSDCQSLFSLLIPLGGQPHGTVLNGRFFSSRILV